jgi:hypothetical protein
MNLLIYLDVIVRAPIAPMRFFMCIIQDLGFQHPTHIQY